MKKLLLVGFALAISAGVMAQNRMPLNPKNAVSLKSKAKHVAAEQTVAPMAPKAPVKRNGFTPSTTAISVITLGQSANVLTVASGPRTALYADPNLNAVALTHRAIASAPLTSGHYVYDLSTDGGATFTNMVGPLYDPTAAPATSNGRYPQGLIWNPAGNTNTANAKMTFVGPSLAIGGTFGGIVSGSADLIGATNPSKSEIIDAKYNVPDGLAINPVDGNVWASYYLIDPLNAATAASYNDTIWLYKGVLTGGNIAYSEILLPAPYTGAIDEKTVTASNIAWAPNGQVGYVALQGHESFVDVPDSNLYYTVWKTTDAGANWVRTAAIDLANIDNVIGGGIGITTGFEFDMTVDANNNLHIVSDVAPAAGGFSIASQAGFLTICDIYTTDGGNDWKAQVLGFPLGLRGTWTDATAVAEDNRPQATRTWDGTKLFFTWFDTDTLAFGTNNTNPNLFPDAHCVAYDVTSGLWTNEINFTTGTDADGLVMWGSVSPYALVPSAGTYNIPMSFIDLTGGGPSSLVTHKYINGANVVDADFTVTGTPEQLGNFVISSVNEITPSDKFAVGANYPNPFTGTTSIDLNFKKSTSATIEIYSVIGKLVKSFDYTNLPAGKSTVTLNLSDLSSGVYTYSVNAEGSKITSKMIIK